MAWVEGKTWEIEQGAPAPFTLRCWSDTAKTAPYSFTGWDINATIYDERGRQLYPCIVSISGADISINITDEQSEDLKPGKTYFFDALGVPPGNAQKHFIAAGNVDVQLRKSREDP